MTNDFDIKKIAESGQCFRINPCGENAYLAVARDKCCKVTLDGDILCSKAEFDAFWADYFDFTTDYAAIRSSIDPKDEFLIKAAEYGKGIRILRQDPWEMLITFIISQRKNIPAIKSCVEMLSKRFGSIIGEENGTEIFAFPTPTQLAGVSMNELKSCSLGYRDEYVHEAAVAVSEGKTDLKLLASLNDEELFESLLKLKGIGPKVANCVLLFGFHRVAAFPVDVWIKRVIDEIYSGSFPLERYDGYAGIIQQYMFFYGKNTL